MNWLDFVLLGLATWRLSRMMVKEDGPGMIFHNLREWVGITHDRDGEVLTVPVRFLPQLLSCVWCTSVWVGAFWVAFWYLARPVSAVFSLAFALSTAAILLDKWISTR